jgi:hypothetical protein
VLSIIEVDMLVTSDARSTATQLWYKSRNILEKARQQIELPGALTTNVSGFASKETSPRQPPEMPPYSHPPPRPEGIHQTPTKQNQGRLSSSTLNHYGARHDRSPDRATAVEDDGSGRNDKRDVHGGFGVQRERSNRQSYPYPGRRSQASDMRKETEFTNQERVGPSDIHSRPHSHQKQSSDPSRSEYSERRSRSSFPDSVGESEYGMRSQDVPDLYQEDDVSHQNILEGPSPGRNRSKRDHPDLHEIRKNLPKVKESSGDSYGDVSGNSTALRNPQKSGPNHGAVVAQIQVTEEPIPFLSVAQATLWKSQNQARMSIGFGIRLGPPPDPLPHQYLQRRLKDRDHVCTKSRFSRSIS